jgi:predicted nucleic acid-binding Zn ribbon protein
VDTDPEPGSSLAYRCADCMERFDVVWQEDLEDEPETI